MLSFPGNACLLLILILGWGEKIARGKPCLQPDD